MNTAQIILLLVSPDFMASDYCYGIEMQRALERHDRGEARVIPIILRPVYWQGLLGKLQALPTDAKPVMSSSWQFQDEAFFNVTEGIRKVVEQITSLSTFAPPSVSGERQQEVTNPSVLTLAIQHGRNVSPSLAPHAIEELALLRTLTGHTNGVMSVALSANGQTLVSGSWDNTIKVWNPLTGKEVGTLTGHTSHVHCVALSADGQTLVSGSEDKTIKVWNSFTGKEVRTLIGHTSSVFSIALSADGQILASGSGDNTIKVWDLSTGKEVRKLTGHTGSVVSVALSANGRTLVSGSWDNTIRVWNLSTGKRIRTLTGYTNAVKSVALSADGQTLVSGSNRTITVWYLSNSREMSIPHRPYKRY